MSEGLRSTPDADATRARITAGLFYAAARFLPVPIVDDLLRERIAGWLVERTLAAAGRTVPRDVVRALRADSTGCLAGCLGSVIAIPIQLLLFPIRKVLAIVLGARWVGRDVASAWLLGRTLDHALTEPGLLAGVDAPEAELVRRAHAIRRAFDRTRKTTDSRFFSAMLATGLGPIREVMAATTHALRRMWGQDAAAPTITPAEAPAIDASVGRVERALQSPEARQFLAEFDGSLLAALDEELRAGR